MTLEDLKNNIDRILMESPELRLREVVVKDTAEREIIPDKSYAKGIDSADIGGLN